MGSKANDAGINIMTCARKPSGFIPMSIVLPGIVPRRSGRPVSAFTMLEIVMVVATIIVVVSFLLPTLGEARSSGYRTECTTHLRQVALALHSYADDYGMYPFEDPLTTSLADAGYLGSPGHFECPLDRSLNGDTYSVGYLGSHPRENDHNTALVVCGWHGRFGTLVVFQDGRVGKLDSGGGTTVPVTVVHGGSEIPPGFVLHKSDPVVISTGDGEQAFLTGENGTHFLSASYDPLADDGGGAFIIIVGYDLTSNSNQKVGGQSNKPIVINTKLEYVNLEVTSNPSQNETRLTWKPKNGYNQVQLAKFQSYRIVHRVTGETEETSNPATIKTYNPDAFALN